MVNGPKQAGMISTSSTVLHCAASLSNLTRK